MKAYKSISSTRFTTTKALAFSSHTALRCVSGITTLILATSVFGVGSYDFNDGTTQGWTIDQMYVTATQQKYTPASGYVLGNINNTLAPYTSALLHGSTSNCEFFLESPDVSSNPDWQNLTGYSIEVTRNMTSPCWGDFPDLWYVQLQAKVIDTADGNKEKLFAEHDGSNFVFHEIYSTYQLYPIIWSDWSLPSPQYIIKQIRLRILGPGDVSPGECWYRGNWQVDNIGALSAAGTTVMVTASDAFAGEPGTGEGDGTFTFTRVGNLSAALTVNFAASGSATPGSDYTDLGSTVTFSASSATAIKTVSVLDNPATEVDEEVVVTLGAGTGYSVGASASATVTIKDDDTGPENDTCGGAFSLVENAYYAQNTTDATEDGYSPCLQRIRHRGLWYTYTPTQSGTATVDTFPGDFDTTLEIFLGDCSELFPIGCNDDASGFQSAVTFPCVSNTTYFIWAGSYADVGGNLQTRVVVNPALVNDTCYGATEMKENVYLPEDTTTATDDGHSPWLGRDRTKGVWFSFSPLLSGTVTIDTFPSDFDTMLEVFQGDCSLMAIVASNDDYATGTLQSFVSFQGESGASYLIWAGGFNGAYGTLQLRVRAPILAWNREASGDLGLYWSAPYTLETCPALTNGWTKVTSGTSFIGPYKTNTVETIPATGFFHLK